MALSLPDGLFAQGYSGPSLLSRGGNSPGRRGRAPVSFNVYAAVRGSYESGLIAPILDREGNLSPANMAGLQAEVGAYGAHSWKRSSIGLDYRGDYRKYTRQQYFDGTNQALSLDYMYQRRRSLFFIRETGGTSNRAFGGFAAPAFVDGQNFGVPLNEVFDSRMYYSQTSGGAMYRLSARNQVQLTGDFFFVKRTGGALISMQGYRAGARFERRVTRSDTVSIGYDFIKFEYPHVYGGSDIHSVTLGYSKQFTPQLAASVTVGAFRAETVGTQVVTLSPEIALILGRATAVEAFHRTDIQPRFNLGMSYTMARSRLFANVNTGVGPGNGIYITSRQDSANGGYSYTGFHRWSLGVSAGYTKFHSLALHLGGYSTFQAGGGMNYRIRNNLNFSMQCDHRTFESPGIQGRSGTSISAGLAFSFSDIPLSIF